ncbi:MAG: 16S rRNA (cytidine(1402)-2'-O)-methyltransferase [Bdellovibrionales bacterium]
MSAPKNAGRKEKASPDFPRLARKMAEASRDDTTSKLPSGLYVVATPIGNLGDITLRALWVLGRADCIACEDTRLSGTMLTQFGIEKKLLPYHDHNAEKARPEILRKLGQGQSVALISDAGMPLIADPGFKLVRACREADYDVTVIPGANAALAALAGCGLPTDRFFFVGFLPPKSAARRKALENLPADTTLVFYEAPQRLGETLADLETAFGAARPAAVARELTKFFEETRAATLGELARHYGTYAAKGEIVIVVAPGEKKIADAGAIDDLLRRHLKTLSLRDAVAAVSEATGARKNEVYTRALGLRDGSGS